MLLAVVVAIMIVGLIMPARLPFFIVVAAVVSGIWQFCGAFGEGSLFVSGEGFLYHDGEGFLYHDGEASLFLSAEGSLSHFVAA